MNKSAFGLKIGFTLTFANAYIFLKNSASVNSNPISITGTVIAPLAECEGIAIAIEITQK